MQSPLQMVVLVASLAWLGWRFWPVEHTPPRRVKVDEVTLCDGRVLVGRYDSAAGVVDVLDDSAQPTERVVVAAAQVESTARGELRVPRRVGPGIDGTWLTDWPDAKELAIEDGVPILALVDGVPYVGPAWCAWSRRPDVFIDPAFRTWATGRVVLYHFDIDDRCQARSLWQQNRLVMERFIDHVVPEVLVIDPRTETTLRRTHDVKSGFVPWVHGLTSGVAELAALAP